MRTSSTEPRVPGPSASCAAPLARRLPANLDRLFTYLRGGLSKLWSLLGPYYNTGPNTGPNLGDPKWDHNFDNHPRIAKGLVAAHLEIPLKPLLRCADQASCYLNRMLCHQHNSALLSHTQSSCKSVQQVSQTLRAQLASSCIWRKASACIQSNTLQGSQNEKHGLTSASSDPPRKIMSPS